MKLLMKKAGREHFRPALSYKLLTLCSVATSSSLVTKDLYRLRPLASPWIIPLLSAQLRSWADQTAGAFFARSSNHWSIILLNCS